MHVSLKKENSKLLLVRVRDNQHWYLPGGKIEQGEIASEALKKRDT
ncbi:NUDIX domain-containing protein [Bacillus cereus]